MLREGFAPECPAVFVEEEEDAAELWAPRDAAALPLPLDAGVGRAAVIAALGAAVRGALAGGPRWVDAARLDPDEMTSVDGSAARDARGRGGGDASARLVRRERES
jgi:hypothetical protein